uniref:Reverse transcriptase RNase H-like domain-containing protein n=1 Tax=Phlebotomus papatasi TaxID=29031 RepID=A0A1B0DGV6_PHLPP
EPVLALYDPESQHEVWTDACKTGLSGILVQISRDEKRRAVAYFSRSTTPAETNYSSYELETLAVLASLERFQYYLLNKSFTVVTDCQSLAATKKKAELNARVARWWMRLQIFDFNVRHRAAKWLRAPDALSRAPVEKPNGEQSVEIGVFRVGVDMESWISTLQNQDEKLKEIIDVISDSQSKHPERNHWLKEYSFSDGRLYKNDVTGFKFVVPKGCRYHVLRGAHDDMGHPGFERTEAKERMQNHYARVAQIHNRGHKSPRKYQEGDIVLIRAEPPATGQSRKLLPRFKGPYMVSKVLEGDRYEVRDTDSTQITQIPYVSVQAADRMKLWPKLHDFDLGADDFE